MGQMRSSASALSRCKRNGTFSYDVFSVLNIVLHAICSLTQTFEYLKLCMKGQVHIFIRVMFWRPQSHRSIGRAPEVARPLDNCGDNSSGGRPSTTIIVGGADIIV